MKEFISAYLGESEYTINGVRYRVKVCTDAYEKSICNPGVFEREILPRVGTVIGKFGIFPPRAVMAEFPGYVAARWNAIASRIETQGEPDVIPNIRGSILFARACDEKLQKLGL